MNRLSLNARADERAAAGGEVQVVLLKIDHPVLTEPVMLSTDATHVLSVEPLEYGTRSSWLSPDGQPYKYVVMDAVMPADEDGILPAMEFVLRHVPAGMASVLRMVSTRATASIAVALASNPDVPEWVCLGLKMMAAEIQPGELTLSFSRDYVGSEPWPSHRITRQTFPGLFR